MTKIHTGRKLVTAFAAASLVVSGALVVLAAAPSGAASTVSPTTTNDDGSAGSLRGVLETAGPGDTIVLSAGASYQLTRCTENLDVEPLVTGFGAIDIPETVTIEGNGATIEQTCLDRVLLVEQGITLNNVTITGGDADGDGGGMLAGNDTATPVVINDTTFVDNTADGEGGGVKSFGQLTITGSTFTDNHATAGSGGGVQLANEDGATITNSTFVGNTTTEFGGGFESEVELTAAGVVPISISGTVFRGNTADSDGGGGVDTEGPHSVTVANSTFDANHGGHGGGLAMFGGIELTVGGTTFDRNVSDESAGAVFVTGSEAMSQQPGEGSTAAFVNSTVTGNTQAGGGAITVGGTATLVYVTLTDNTNTGVEPPVPPAATDRGGVGVSADEDGTANVVAADLVSFATVITGPVNGANCFSENPPTSHGYNFTDDDTCGFTGTGDRENAGDPGLGSLAANGGSTETELPTVTSPLLDAVPPTQCEADGAAGVDVDQRGITRPQGSGCDIGAVEVVVEVVEELPLIAPRFTG